jgi:hypothetical protein
MSVREMRARAQKTTPSYGQIQREFEELLQSAKVINDGLHDYQSKEDFCHSRDKLIDMNNSDDTHLDMTYKGYDIVDFRDGKFRVIVHQSLKLRKTDGGFPDFTGDMMRLIKFVIGWKHGEVISDMECEIANYDTKLKTKDVVRSMYISHKSRGKEVMKNSREHMLWCAIEKFDRNISGCFFDAYDIDKNTGIINLKPYEIIIPHTAFLEFQKWELYPVFLLGNVNIKVKASVQGCVITQVPIEAVFNQLMMEHGNHTWKLDDWLEYPGDVRCSKRDFTQLGNPFNACVGWAKPETSIEIDDPTYPKPTFGSLTAYDEGSNCELKTIVYGFNIPEQVKANIASYFDEDQYIPAQTFQFETIDKTNADEPVDGSLTIKTTFVELIDVLFPKHGNDYTVFENPCLKNFQIQLDNNINYPEEKLLSTFAPKLLSMVRDSAEIGCLQLSHDLIASYVEPRNRSYSPFAPIGNTRYACSDFSIPIDLQRNHNEGAFDGYIADHGLLSLEIEYEPLTTGVNNSYAHVDGTDKSPTCAQLFICKNAHWRIYRDQHNELRVEFITTKLIPGTQPYI